VTTGPVTVQATEAASIDAISARHLWPPPARSSAVAVSGAGAQATNVILTRTNAHIDGSIIKSTGAVRSPRATRRRSRR
jgi:hypothetical protein